MNTKPQRKAGTARSEVLEAIPAACSDEAKAVEFLERARWGASGPACPRCGSVEVYQMTSAKTGQRSARWLWRCRGCKRQYTVRVGTVMEDSAVPLRHWCLAYWLACAGKKGVSAKQIERQTGLSYKSALFLMHRIRWSMAEDSPQEGLLGGTVEADECYIGGKPKRKNNEGKHSGRKQGPKGNLQPVLAAVERGGRVRASHAQKVTAANLDAFLRANVADTATLYTDDNRLYTKTGPRFPGGHHTVKHSQYEYARGPVHTNTVEGYFSLLKRQIFGTHHAVSPKHLHRYVSESQYKYNTRKLDDGERTVLAIKRGDGRRLTHKGQTA